MKRPTSLTAAAGEHYVAYWLSALGFPVALTRGGSPGVDLLVTDVHGTNAIALQVKTSTGARRAYSRQANSSKNHWEWDVGQKALGLRSESLFYAFVDLQWSMQALPEVFIVPSATVASFLQPGWSRYMFWITDADAPKFRNNWDLITTRLTPAQEK